MSERPHLVFVGGFLGAGKTTLIQAAARELEKRGLRSAAILNDQGEALVDTELARATGMPTGEVTGGCFCCRFSELATAAEQLRQHAPDVIFAEPVGSCTDISATILQPMQLYYRDAFKLAPFTVLVDPGRAQELLAEECDPDLAFLFRKQLQEADLICATKSDIYPACPEIKGATVRRVSAVTGQGVAAWLDEVLSGMLTAGQHILEIDYEQYAKAEASLAWLNLEVEVHCDPPATPAMLLGPLMDGLDASLTTAGIRIVHLKAIDTCTTGFLKAAICRNGVEPDVQGALDASPAVIHELLLNLRAASDPDPVRSVVLRELAQIPGTQINLRVACFRPGAPKPEYRISMQGGSR